MAEYTYDESGAVFNFFLLAVLTTLLLPATYWGLVKGRKTSGTVKKSSPRSWYSHICL
jgi:preprotein translocase subunit Sec63